MSESHPLGPYVRRFLLEHVVADRSLSLNTQKSYRDTIRLLLLFVKERHGMDPTRVSVEQVTASVIRSFLDYIKNERGNSPTTRNQRLATIRSLFRYIARQTPELVATASEVQGIPLQRTASTPVPYLEKAEMDALLETPDRQRTQGLQEYALLLFLYNTGARAQEAASGRIGDLDLNSSPSVRIHGKGNKTRICPLWPHTVKVLQSLLGPRLLDSQDETIFLNIRGQPFTRFGIHSLIERIVEQAAELIPSLRTKRVSPHTIRHTTAVHLLRSGVDINTIRAWLGHVSLETCAVSLPHKKLDRKPAWRKDHDLLEFLTSL